MRLMGFIFASLMLMGCQPRLFEYYVIALPTGDAVQALESGEVENDMVYFAEPVVTKYRLDRDGYTLLGRLDFRTPHPTIDLAAHDPAGAALEIVPLRVGPCGSFKTFGLLPEINGYPASRYHWRPRWNEDCDVEGRGPYPPEQVMKFEVRSVAGRLLEVAEIPFELHRNGTYLEFDAL